MAQHQGKTELSELIMKIKSSESHMDGITKKFSDLTIASCLFKETSQYDIWVGMQSFHLHDET